MKKSAIQSAAGLLAAWLMAGAAFPALAQDAPQAPDYAPQGLPMGAFRVYPALYLGIAHDDNVYRTQTGTVDDTIYYLGGTLTAQSDWTRHQLNLTAAVDGFRYDQRTLENHTEWQVGADGRLDILRGSAFSGAATYATRFEPRSSPNETGFAAEPTEFAATHLAGSLSHRPNRFGVEAGGSYDNFDFKNTPLIGGGTLNNRDRDHSEVMVYARASYEFSPGYSTFLRGSYEERDFALNSDRSGLRRDSDGYAIDAGLEMAVTNLIQGNIFAGYIDHNYYAPLPDVSGFNYGASLTWYPTQLLTVQLNASRRLVDTTLAGVSATDDRHFGAVIDYEFLRNVLVRGNVDYTSSDFPGSSREDELFAAGIGVRYFMNNYISAEARYDYSTRTSSVPGQGFDDNLFRINLNLHL